MSRRSRSTRRSNRKNLRKPTRRGMKRRKNTNRKVRRNTNRKVRRNTMRRRNSRRNFRRMRGGANSIYVVSYSGTITGGKELRVYNEHFVSSQYGGGNEKGSLLHYYNMYDNQNGGKKNEPFFDAFLIHMAHLKPSSYNTMGLTDISYFEEAIDDETGANDGPESKFKVTITEKDHKDSIRSIYSNAKHIFIMSPFAQYMVDEINLFADQATPEQPLIIHIQGDACNGGSPDDAGIRSTGGGLFGEAFNLFSGGLSSQQFRINMLSRNAIFLSVSPQINTGIPGYSLTVKEKKSGKMVDVTYTVPNYYVLANEHILEAASSGTVYDIFDMLDVHKVYQDGTDKDNLASLNLMNLIYNERVVPADFIGFRIYASSSLPIAYKFLKYPEEKLTGVRVGYVPEGGSNAAIMAPVSDEGGEGMAKKISQLSFFPHPLRFESPMGEFMKPAGDYNTGNVKFEPEITMRFYDEQYRGFKEILDKSKKEGVGVELKNKGPAAIVDGLGNLSASKRAPFNMSLYWFPPETYMADALIVATRTDSYYTAIQKIKGPTVLGD